ncbi:MAG: Coq4 family protein [Sphingomonas sp.]
MPQMPPMPGTTGRRDWKTAISAMRKLLADSDDTAQVFLIMRALNAGNLTRNAARMLATHEGGKLMYEREELARTLSDKDYVASFAPGTVGAAYRDFLTRTGYSAAGLEQVSRDTLDKDEDVLHPYIWFGRRIRDTHDIWHTLTGYQADEPLGEAALVAFSYAQVGGLGWAWIAAAASIKSILVSRRFDFARAVWEGYRHGRKAKWLPVEDYHALLNEPLEAARRRLNIGEPVLYRRAQAAMQTGWDVQAPARQLA